MQTDPFASIGGGVQLPNGQWVPRNHPLAQQFLASQGGTAPPPVAQAAPTTPDPFASIGGGRQVNGGWVPKNMPDQPTLGGGGFTASGPVAGGAPNQPPADPYLEAASRNVNGGAIEQPEANPGYADLAQQTPRSDYAAPAGGDLFGRDASGTAPLASGSVPIGAQVIGSANAIARPSGDFGQGDAKNWADGQVPDYWKNQASPMTLGGLQSSNDNSPGGWFGRDASGGAPLALGSVPIGGAQVIGSASATASPDTLGAMGDVAKQAKRNRFRDLMKQTPFVGGSSWGKALGGAVKGWG